MNRKEVGLKIAKIRISKDISAYELSLRIDRAHNYINSIEVGKLNPSLESLLRIAKELNVSPKEFFD